MNCLNICKIIVGNFGGSKYDYKNNRKYLKKMILPCDDEEKDRLRQQHWLLHIDIIGCMFKSPLKQKLKKGIYVLDSGCGSGIWLTNMAKLFPNSLFYGIDIFSIDVNMGIKFFKHNIIQETIWYEKFDFIYQRLLNTCLKDYEWAIVIKNLYKCCKKGGWIELIEIDLKVYEAKQEFQLVNYKTLEMLRNRGIDPQIVKKLPNILRNIGFTVIEINTYKVYMANVLFFEDMYNVAKACKPYLEKTFNFKNYEDKIRKIFEENKQAYFIWYNIIATK